MQFMIVECPKLHARFLKSQLSFSLSLDSICQGSVDRSLQRQILTGATPLERLRGFQEAATLAVETRVRHESAAIFDVALTLHRVESRG
jgi:hypothetical protein